MAKVNIDINAKDKASKKIGSVAGSMLKAQLAFEGVKMVTKALINVGKQAIELFKEQEKQEKQLETVLKSTAHAAGLTAEEVKNMASSLQDATTFGDEAILSGQNLLLTFTKIGKDVFPAATETMLNMSQAMGQDMKQSAIQVGKALNDPIQGVTSLRRVGVQLSEQQEQQVKDFMAVNDIASAQKIILGELETQFGGSARAARDTFGGALKALKNVQGDNLEAVGKIVSVVGKDFVKSMTEGATALNKFINNTNMIADVAATFEVVKQVLQDIGDAVFKEVSTAVTEIVGAFGELEVKGDINVRIFDKLVGIFKGLGIALTVGIKLVTFYVRAYVNLINVVKNAGKAVIALAQAIASPKKWKEAKKSFQEVGDAFKNLGKDMFDDAKDLIVTVVDEFKKFPTGVESSVKKYENIFFEANKKIRDEFRKKNDEIEADDKKLGDKLAEPKKGFIQSWKDAAAEVKAAFQDMNPLEQFQEITNKINSHGSQWIGIVQDFTGQIQGMIQSMHQETLAKQQEAQEEQLAGVDAWMEEEMIRQGVREATKQEKINKEVKELQKKLKTETDAQKKKDIQELIAEKQKELARQKILDSAEKQKEKIRKDALQKMTEEKRKQFNINKGFSIADVWLSAATAVMGWWAAFSGMGIPGIVLAAVMTASTLAMAGAQTGIIASQTFHGEQGGIVPIGGTTGDNTMLFANKGEALLRNDDFNSLVDMAKGEKGASSIIIQHMEVVANNPEEFRAQHTT
jgi:hypothetical protein